MDIIKTLLDYIECKYHKIYTREIKLIIDGHSYSTFFELNNIDRPLCIGGEFETDELFYNYLKKEFDQRKLYNSKYFVLKMDGYLSLNGEKIETNNINNTLEIC